MANKPVKLSRPRNIVARTAMFRRAGVHEKSRTSKRQQQKRDIDNAIVDYLNKEAPTSNRSFSLLSGYFHCLFSLYYVECNTNR